MPNGLHILIEHTGATASSLFLNDIKDGTTEGAGVSARRPGPVYVPAGGSIELIYTASVAESFENGTIRSFLENGLLTATFRQGDETWADLAPLEFSPDNYAPVMASPATATNQLTSHLRGIDLTLGLLGATDIIVPVGPNREFTTIESALASITDNSQTKLYVVRPDPGIHLLTSTLNLKPYVLIQGYPGSVLVYVGSGGPAIEATFSTSIFDVTIVDGIGVGNGATAIRYDGQGAESSPGGVGTAFALSGVRFGTFHRLLEIDGTTNVASFAGVDVSWGGTAPFNEGFEVYGSNALLSMRSCTTVSDTMAPTLPTFMVKVYDGAQATIRASNFRSGGTAGDCFWAYDGGSLKILACIVEGWTKAFFTELIGAAPTLRAIGVECSSNTEDLTIEHPGTVGSFTGAATSSKITILSDDFGFSYLGVENSEFSIRDSLTINESGGSDSTDILDLLVNQGLGLISGGQISDVGGLDIAITDLVGYYRDGSGVLQKAELSSIPNRTLPDDTESYIYVDSSGAITDAAAPPTVAESIFLGRVVTQGGGILLIDGSEVLLDSVAQNYAEIAKVVFGSRYVSGTVFSAGTGPLNLDVTAGRYYYGANEYTPSGGSDITFTTYRSDGAGGWITSDTDTLDDENYDNSGVLTAIPGGEYVKHSMYVLNGSSTRYFLVYGQETFASLANAQSGNLPTPPPLLHWCRCPCGEFRAPEEC